MTPGNDLILATLDHFADGHIIHPESQLVELGYDVGFLKPLEQTYVDEPDNPHKTLRNAATEQRLEHMKGVHDLDILEAIAKAVGADCREVRAFGSGRRARQYADAITVKLTGQSSKWAW